jgi:hypothetical protein
MKTQFVIASQRPDRLRAIDLSGESGPGDVNIVADGQVVAWFDGKNNQLMVSERFLKQQGVGLKVMGDDGTTLIEFAGE